jgi:Zn-dependent protease
MPSDPVQIYFQIAVFLFAISMHESAHAWMANLRGDPTARMLGRITLNPIKHIDPVGTLILPVILIILGMPVFGWAKPTPVDPRNFKSPVLDDVLTSVAGPFSHVAFLSLVLGIYAAITAFNPSLKVAMYHVLTGSSVDSLWMPFAQLMVAAVIINVVLGIFNMLPIPPLDGSHVVRHLLPESARRVYDSVGMFGIILIFAFGGKLVSPIIGAVVRRIFVAMLQ